MNQYFADHPEMIMGKMEMVSGQFGMEATCIPDTTIPLSKQLENWKPLHQGEDGLGYTGVKAEALKGEPHKPALPSGGQYRKALPDADHSLKRKD